MKQKLKTWSLKTGSCCKKGRKMSQKLPKTLHLKSENGPLRIYPLFLTTLDCFCGTLVGKTELKCTKKLQSSKSQNTVRLIFVKNELEAFSQSLICLECLCGTLVGKTELKRTKNLKKPNISVFPKATGPCFDVLVLK